ncbi:MAG: trigger factor [Vallitaleaceae bacterium]|jgi:trigger factor|nr:trigger factor [Vallitaleaceae bacterium]
MSTQIEKLENSMVKLTIEVNAATFEKGMVHAYNTNKGKISVQGFRKGKAPRKMIEKIYGASIFYEDAANHVIPEAYDLAVEETGLEVVSRPSIDVEQIEQGKPFIFTAEVAVKPEVTVKAYKGIKGTKQELVVTEEDIQKEIDKVLEQNARLIDVVDRAVVDGDEVTIDFEGFVDDEPFEGGKGTDYQLVIGSHSFIDTFEGQLIGASIGDAIDITVTFPAEYHQESLKGKPALFKVVLKAIKTKEFPEVDDEFAQDVSEFDTLVDYKADIEVTIKERLEKDAKRKIQEEIMTTIIDSLEVELPAPMIDLEAENMTYEFAQRLQGQGLNLEQYMSMTGQNMASLKEMMKKDAGTKIKSRLILEYVAKEEDIVITDDVYNAELVKMADMYNMELDQLMENIGEDEADSIKQDMMNQQALNLSIESAKLK